MSEALPTQFQRAAIPAALLRFQQKWVAETADVAFWEKSRRIGASWCTASLAVLTSAAAEGMDTLYIGYSEDMTREFIDDCAMWAKAFSGLATATQELMFEDQLENGERSSIKAFRIDFASGSKILALSSRPRSIRGKQGLVIIDEAAFHDDLPGLLKAAMALLIWGGKVRVLSSHNGEAHSFNETIINIRSGRLPYALHRTTLDDALADGLYQRVCLKTGKTWSADSEKEWRDALFKRYGDNADEELLCIPSQGTGVWLPRALIEARMTEPGPALHFKGVPGMALWPEHLLQAHIADWCERELLPQLRVLDSTCRSVAGLDFARKVDLSVLTPMQIGATLKKRVPFTVEMSKTPYNAQKQIVFYVLKRLPRFSHAKFDTGGNGDWLGEEAQREFGELRIEKVNLTELWYRENTAPLKADLEDGVLSLIKDDDTANDLAAFRLVRGVPRVPDIRTTGSEGEKRHGDAGIALVLAHAAARANYVPIEFQSTGVARFGRGMSDYMGGLDG